VIPEVTGSSPGGFVLFAFMGEFVVAQAGDFSEAAATVWVCVHDVWLGQQFVAGCELPGFVQLDFSLCCMPGCVFDVISELFVILLSQQGAS
jgi:hypothetical protein